MVENPHRTTCPITGDAVVSRVIDINRGDYLRWDRADPETHVTEELLAELDETGRAFLEAMYEVGEPCPEAPSTRHARRREAD